MNKENGQEILDAESMGYQGVTKFRCESGNGDSLSIMPVPSQREVMVSLRDKNGMRRAHVFLSKKSFLDLKFELQKAIDIIELAESLK